MERCSGPELSRAMETAVHEHDVGGFDEHHRVFEYNSVLRCNWANAEVL